MQGNLHTLLALTKGLPLTYNRDLQEDKPPVFDSFDQAALCADVLEGTVGGITFNRERCLAAVSDPALLATDLADYLVERGVPFRAAHHAVGNIVALAERKKCQLPELSNEEVMRLHPGFGPDWASVFDLNRAVEKRKGTGMPGPAQIAKQFARWKKLLG
jgi:argininosuccinate lyase